VFPEIDLAGDKRIYEEIVDLGAYEWSGTANPEADIPLADVSTMSIYPNPFKQTATISFQQKSIGTVNIDVFNVKGQLVKTLLSEHKNSGSNQITWDGRDHNGKMCSSGIYYCRVVSNNKTYTRKLMLVK
jgi:flagellar hook assembly protein FlgD